MTVNTLPNYTVPAILGAYPCEGPKTIKVPLDFATDPEQIVDLSLVQSQGQWSATQTIYIDNSLNGSAVFIEMNTSYQTMTCPPGGMLQMEVLQPNPPKFKFTSAGGIVVPVHFINFFMPPIIWGPTAPPGGGGSGGGITLVTVTDFSGATPVTIPANPLRKYLLISNPVANAASTFFTIGGGGAIELTLGAVYESGAAVPAGAVVITNAGGGAIVAYEGV